jgi:integrase
MLILTGQRRDEVSESTWPEFNLATRTWLIPRERVKNNQEHEVALCDQAVSVLERLPRIAGKKKFVFTTSGESSVAGFSRAKRRLDAMVLMAARKVAADQGEDPASVEPPARWTLHDLRRTVASGMARLGIGLPVIEKILNHTSGSFAGIVGVYQRHSFSDEKRKALETWGRFVETTVTDKPSDNVVALRG